MYVLKQDVILIISARRVILTDLNLEIPTKVQVTLSLDMETIEYFKHQAEKKRLQQINLALKHLVTG